MLVNTNLIDMSNGKNLQDSVSNIDIDEDGNIISQLKNIIEKLQDLEKE